MRSDKEIFQFALAEIEAARQQTARLQAHVSLTERLLALFESTPTQESVAMGEDVAWVLRKKLAEMESGDKVKPEDAQDIGAVTNYDHTRE